MISNYLHDSWIATTTDTWDLPERLVQDSDDNNTRFFRFTRRSREDINRDGSGNYPDHDNGSGAQRISWNREQVCPQSHVFPH